MPKFSPCVIMKSMDKKEEKELEYLFAHMNRLWAGLMVLGGGLFGIIFSDAFKLSFNFASIFKFILLILGFLTFFGMFIGLINIKEEIHKKIKGGLK